MQKTYRICLPLLLSANLCLLACAEAWPSMKKCESIYVRSSDGWWLSINKDGSGSYGFGTGLARVEVTKSTFGFEQVYAEIEKAFVSKQQNAEEPYMAVSCWRPNAGSSVEHRLAQDRRLLARLFLAARANARVPQNELEARAHDQVESLWQTSPWKESPYISPNKPDAGAGK
ncbi:MAG: hypothetical protein AMS18_17765 [Gemmatimonas sp. SG8_17]|nr:MAG: hypothetical protein AMS18_17765 [Gemmatimonas sp. SG8_17]